MHQDKCTTGAPRIFKNDVSYFDINKLKQVSRITNALSDPIRLQMIYLLEQREDICTCEFQELLDLTQPKVSYHLKVLMDVGIIERKVVGNWRYYSLIKKDILKKVKLLLD
ncbi:ArsR/SmtB family transcription factor [Clostridium sp. UBA6640]|uniref:ArsR/SmtB family transcription factor n=1 Tax=Clostridium sp. UBA6640 TaxID=1946370 RepID=UPI0025BB7657|nr:metalloregulator ArsR/SmtB family transcription factor [Clostridium sp. UBA6640]